MTDTRTLIKRTKELLSALPDGSWYVEPHRPGHPDEARIYDKHCRGVAKLTTGDGEQRLRARAEYFAQIPDLLRDLLAALPQAQAVNQLERKHLHDLLAEAVSLINPEAHSDLVERIDAVLIPCEGGVCAAAPPAPDARLRGLENVLAAALQYIEADRAWRRVDYTLNCDPETKASFRCTQDDFARSRERYWKAKDALWEASLRAHEGEKFDPAHDQEALCECGHTYNRHFDWGDDYRPGCKYCECRAFRAHEGTGR